MLITDPYETLEKIDEYISHPDVDDDTHTLSVITEMVYKAKVARAFLAVDNYQKRRKRHE